MKPRWNELLALFLAAGASLLYQVTLTKIFEYSVWANYAYLVISTAMFGLGFSGVLLTRFPGLLKFRERGFLTVTCLFTAVGMVLGFLAVNHVPIHLPDAPNGWPKELLNVGIVFLGLALPFVFFGLLISYLLEKRAQYANIYYFADLVGAGLGCFALVPLIPIWEPQGLVLFCVVATVAATLLFLGDKIAPLLAVAVMIAACLLPFKATEWFPLNVHVDKREYTQDLEKGRIEAHAYSALSRVDIAQFDDKRKRVWIAGGVNESNMRKFSGDFEALRGDYENQYNQATGDCDVRILPHLSKRDHLVCMIGTSGGDDSFTALKFGAGKVVGVEMDPQIVRFVTETYKDYAGGLFTDGKYSEIAIDEGRSFLRRDTRKFDVIQQVNNFTPIAFQNGALNLSETYLLTVESFHDFYDSLSDDGILSISRWGTYRLQTTAIQMLSERGLSREEIAKRIVICKGQNWLKHTMLLKKSAWTVEEIETIQRFYDHVRSETDLAGKKKSAHAINGILYAPYIPPEQLPAWKDGKSLNPYYLVMSTDTPSDYYDFGPFNFSPPTDNKPFFNHFKRLGAVDPGKYKETREVMFAGGSTKIVGRDDIAMLPAEVREIEPPNLLGGRIAKGDLPPIIILAEAILLATLFFGFPLLSKREIREQLKGNKLCLGYFACLGAGFIFVEIVLIQQLVKFLGHPVYSISATIGALLVAAGLGSLFAARFKPSAGTIRAVMWITAVAIVGFSFLLPIVTEIDALVRSTHVVKILVAVGLVGLLGFLMGMPMPTGIRYLKEQGRNVIPWAWAINGYFTVIGSALSVLLALLFGFKAMFFIAAAVYAIGPFFIWSRSRTN